ncbi:unnamed protein product [Brassica oleracea]
MTKKLSGGITYQELEGCLKLLPPEELEHLDILERKDSSSPVKKLVYLSGADSSSPVMLFCCDHVSETVSVHCGFFNENGRFRISDKYKKYMRSFQIVVSACTCLLWGR